MPKIGPEALRAALQNRREVQKPEKDYEFVVSTDALPDEIKVGDTLQLFVKGTVSDLRGGTDVVVKVEEVSPAELVEDEQESEPQEVIVKNAVTPSPS